MDSILGSIQEDRFAEIVRPRRRNVPAILPYTRVAL
jgi:hypothetical protein